MQSLPLEERGKGISGKEKSAVEAWFIRMGREVELRLKGLVTKPCLVQGNMALEPWEVFSGKVMIRAVSQENEWEQVRW